MGSTIKKKFKIKGMHCSSCALTIDFDLEDLDGVKSSKTNYARGETEVAFEEEKIDEQNIIRIIQKTGYEALVEK